MGEGQFSLRARAFKNVLVPMANDVVSLLFDPIEVVRDDLADGLLEARQVGGFPSAEVGDFVVGKILLFVERGVVHGMSQRLKEWSDGGAPCASVIRCVFDCAGKIDSHGER